VRRLGGDGGREVVVVVVVVFGVFGAFGGGLEGLIGRGLVQFVQSLSLLRAKHRRKLLQQHEDNRRLRLGNEQTADGQADL